MKFQAVLFDFDGVLCKDRFYESTLVPGYQPVYDWLQGNIFKDKEVVHAWMTGQRSSRDINRLIAGQTGMDPDVLHGLFEESIRSMELDRRVIDVARRLKASGAKIGIVTDNMDCFTTITAAQHGLGAIFDAIVNSADHGVLKGEKNGELFDIALAALGSPIEKSLMIDDSPSKIELYRKKGGAGFVYTDLPDLEMFLG